MFQAPQTAGKAFPKAILAEMGGGTKVRVATKCDPIIKMIHAADTLLDKYVTAYNAASEIEEKIGDDRRRPSIRRPDGWMEFGGALFDSEEDITRQSLALARRIRQRISHYRAALKRKNLPHQIRIETSQRLTSDLRKLELLPATQRDMLRAFRKERARINRVWRETGYGKARKARSRYGKQLSAITSSIAKLWPETVQGALALIAYISTRMRDDLTGLFPLFEANLDRSLIRVHLFIAREVAR
jgi:hypothetical protein